jgi:hypothetical protein|tara:strand:- start:122 stop:349 length:228 start_codon:yes stop_codon:yes gene_type:complete
MDTNAALIMGDIFSLIFGKTKRLEIGINVSEAIRRNNPDTKDEFIIANNEIIKNKIPNTQLATNEAYFIDIPLFN